MNFIYAHLGVLAFFSQFFLIFSLENCTGGSLPTCPHANGDLCPDGSQPKCLNSLGSEVPITQKCSPACNPLSHTCDGTTAPTCIFPDPMAPGARAACACQIGYKASGYTDNDSTKQWRLPIEGLRHRVWVAEGVKCDALCGISTGTESCGEVMLVAEQCIGEVPNYSPPHWSSNTNDTIPFQENHKPNTTVANNNIKNFDYNVTTSVVKTKNSSTLTTYQFKDPEIFGNFTIDIPVLRPTSNSSLLSNQTNGTVFVETTANAIGHAFPTILRQYGVSDEDIDEMLEDAVPAITEVLFGLFGSQELSSSNSSSNVEPKLSTNAESNSPPDPDGPKRRRSFSANSLKSGLSHVGKEATRQLKVIPKKVTDAISDIGKIDAVCSVFASGALSGYMLETDAVYQRDPGPGLPIMNDQMFFLFPLYGNYPVTEGLRTHYGFRKTDVEKYRAITINRDMYLLANTAVFGPRWVDSDLFAAATATLIHEVRHTLQYRAHGWSRSSFGLQYLFQYCKSGYSYLNIHYEKQAEAEENLMSELLTRELGYSFFEYWSRKNLKDKLGYPLDRAIVESQGTSKGPGRFELRFQKGVLMGINYADCNRCFNVLTDDLVTLRKVVDLCDQRKDDLPSCPGVRAKWEQVKDKFECLPELKRYLDNTVCY